LRKHAPIIAGCCPQGDLNGPFCQLEAAVRLRPDLWRAHFELGKALGRKGDPSGAIEQLMLAAKGSNANLRAEALDC
jgi:hypothetical protein